MPIFRRRATVKLTRNTGLSLGLEAGVTWSDVPHSPDAYTPGQLGRALASRVREITRSRRPGLDGGSRAFFVVGRPRFGNIRLIRLLNSHPEVLCMGEGQFFGGAAWEGAAVEQRDSLRDALSGCRPLKAWIESSVWSKDAATEEQLNGLIRAAMDHFRAQKSSETGKKIVGDAVSFASETIGEIVKVYPDARVIHIIRDGRDLAQLMENHARLVWREEPRSAGEGMFAEEDLREIATSWSMEVSEATKNGPALFGNNHTVVRYEDLLNRPEVETKRLLEFLGAETVEETVRRCMEWMSPRRGREKGRDARNRKGVAYYDWRKAFTERDKRIFKEAAGDSLIAAGYEVDHNW